MCHPASHRRINRIINENCLCVCVFGLLLFHPIRKYIYEEGHTKTKGRRRTHSLTHSPFTMLTLSATDSASYLAGAEEDIS